MKSRNVKMIIGSISTIAGVVCRMWFDGIFFRICSKNSYNEIYVILILIVSILIGITMMINIMPTIVKAIGTVFLGIGVGGATINALVTMCIFFNMNNLAVNICQWLAFVMLFVLSGYFGARKIEEF